MMFYAAVVAVVVLALVRSEESVLHTERDLKVKGKYISPSATPKGAPTVRMESSSEQPHTTRSLQKGKPDSPTKSPTAKGPKPSAPTAKGGKGGKKGGKEDACECYPETGCECDFPDP